MDSLTRETVDGLKIVIYSVLLTAYVASQIKNFEYVSMIFLSLFWLYYCVKMRVLATPSFKKSANLLIVGGILVVIGNLYFLINLYDTSYLWLALEICLVAYVFNKTPSLAYLLPYKVFKIAVIETNSGGSLFNFDWDAKKKMIDENLFSGMLQGISFFVKEAVDQGNLQELRLDNGIMIIYRSQTQPLAFVLVATKVSKTLHIALENFPRQFEAKFAQFLGEMLNVNDFMAQDLVHECFSFIPEVN